MPPVLGPPHLPLLSLELPAPTGRVNVVGGGGEGRAGSASSSSSVGDPGRTRERSPAGGGRGPLSQEGYPSAVVVAVLPLVLLALVAVAVVVVEYLVDQQLLDGLHLLRGRAQHLGGVLGLLPAGKTKKMLEMQSF